MYAQFKERGLSAFKLCTDIGVNSGYFSNAKHRGSIANMMVVLLESRYGIPRNTYVEEKKEPETKVVEVVSHDDFFSEDNMKKLYQIMYSAMYNAVRQALNE